MSIKIKELPETERPYEKLELYGEKSLSNAELLAIIIKNGTKNETSVQLAQRILKLNEDEDENLNFLRYLSLQELMQIKGIGKVKAIQLKAICELSTRMTQPTNYIKMIIKTPSDLAKLLIPKLRYEKQEIAQLVILNNKNQILKVKDIAKGGNNFANMAIREILSEPIKMNAPKIALAHNHPTGDPTPSKKDIEYTEVLYDITQMLGIQLLDHIVIGDNKYISIFSKMIEKQKTKI